MNFFLFTISIIIIPIAGIYSLLYYYKFKLNKKAEEKDMYDDISYNFGNNTSYNNCNNTSYNNGNNINKFICDVMNEIKDDFLSAKYIDKFSSDGKNKLKYIFENGTVVILTSNNYLEYIKGKKGKRAKLEYTQLSYILEYFSICINSARQRPREKNKEYYEYYSFNKRSPYDDYFKYNEKYTHDNYDYTKKSYYKNSEKKYTLEQIKYQDLYKKLKYTYEQRIEQINNLSKYDPDRYFLINESIVVKEKMNSAYKKSGLNKN
jgi:hypothetical protein